MRAVEVGQLEGQVWVASRSDTAEPLLGVWPGLTERPEVRYVVRDWLAKLQIVAAGLAITTLAPITLDVLPGSVKAVAVRGEPQEAPMVLAGCPGRSMPAARVTDALLAAAAASRVRRTTHSQADEIMSRAVRKDFCAPGVSESWPRTDTHDSRGHAQRGVEEGQHGQPPFVMVVRARPDLELAHHARYVLLDRVLV